MNLNKVLRSSGSIESIGPASKAAKLSISGFGLVVQTKTAGAGCRVASTTKIATLNSDIN